MIRVLLVEILTEMGVPIDDSGGDDPTQLLSPVEATIVDLQSQLATAGAEVDARIRRIADLLPQMISALPAEQTEVAAEKRGALD